MRVSVNKLNLALKHFMAGFISVFRDGWSLSSWKSYVSVNNKIAYPYSNKLKSFKSTSILESRRRRFCHLSSFPPGTDKTLQSIKTIHFLKSNDPWLVYECMQHLFPIFIIWKKRTPMTYGAYVYQFNKHVLTNHNKGIVILIGSGAHNPERSTAINSCNRVFTSEFIFI